MARAQTNRSPATWSDLRRPGLSGHKRPLTAAFAANEYVYRMICFRVLALLLIAAASVSAQGSGPRRVYGIVYDSVARAPLSGAVVEVQMVDPDRNRASTSQAPLPGFVVVSDSLGRYELSALPAGLFAVGFQHHVLNALGIESPITPLDLRVDSVARLDLGVPGGRAVRVTACPGRADDGLLAGYVVNARGGAPVAASIEVRWDEIVFANRRMTASHHESKAAPDSTGRFSLCGLPAESPLEMRISADGFRDIETEITLPAHGVIHRDFRLAIVDTMPGAGTIRLRVVDDSGRAVNTGQALIASLGRQASVDSGVVTIGAVPDGTWAVDVRAIGYEPGSVLIDAESASPREATVRIARMPQMLAAVSIVANASKADQAILDGILARMRSAWGTLVLPSDLSLKNAAYASDAVRWARGFRTWGSNVAGRPYSTAGGQAACLSRDFIPPREKGMVVYLDGARVAFGLQGVNDAVRPEDILAVEAYPDVISAPAIWRTNDACAVVAFWTKRR